MKRNLFTSSLLLLLSTGCATSKPDSTTPPAPPRLNLPAIKKTTGAAVFVQPHFQSVTLWQYPPGQWCWTLQSSSNLVDWIDVPGTVGRCITNSSATATNELLFFRLKGSP